MTSNKLPYLGFGLGLRSPHYADVLETKPAVDWFEIITENFLIDGGRPLHYLDKIREHYPIVMHGVSLSIGSVDPINFDYLTKVKALAERIEAPWLSDHLCWTGVGGHNSHDLLPLPYTEEVVEHVSGRIRQVQDFLGRRILLENPSSYVCFKESTMPEWQCMREIAERADCLLLLDVNNVYVSAFNHGFDAKEYIDNIPTERVQQIHLAGHTNKGTHIIDTHDHDIIQDVYDLYAYTSKRVGKVSTMIERDDNIPPFEELLAELEQVKKITA